MWFLVQVVKGNRFFEPESQVGNQVLISDTSEMVIAGRALGTEGYRFEARRGNETFIIREFKGTQAAGTLEQKFAALGAQMGALAITGEA
jgi:hypothetical protein